MGAWGPGIFSDDSACDLRAEFLELIGQGLDPQAATEHLVSNELCTDCPDEAGRFWLALAATQARCGRLTGETRDRALAIIAAGADLKSWAEEGAALLRKRAQVLEKLKTTLLGPQRSPARVAKRYVHKTEWTVGDAIVFALPAGRFLIWRVLGIYRHGLSRYPIFEICDYIGTTIPERAQIERMARRRTQRFGSDLKLGKQFGYAAHVEQTNGQFLIRARRASEYPDNRCQLVARSLHVGAADENGTLFFWASELEERLPTVFGIT